MLIRFTNYVRYIPAVKLIFDRSILILIFKIMALKHWTLHSMVKFKVFFIIDQRFFLKSYCNLIVRNVGNGNDILKLIMAIYLWHFCSVIFSTLFFFFFVSKFGWINTYLQYITMLI